MSPELSAATNAITPAPTSIGLDSLFSSSVVHWVSLAFLSYVALLWIALILWVTKDITNRTNNVLFQIVCISLIIFLTPIFGLVVYLLVRPSRTISDQYYEEIETDFLHSEDPFSCHHCHTKIDLGFTYCPNCGEKNKVPCVSCKKDIPPAWQNCAHCGTLQDRHHTETKEKVKHHEKAETSHDKKKPELKKD